VPKADDSDDDKGGYLTWVILLVVIIVVVVLLAMFSRGKESTTDFSKYGEPVHKDEGEKEPDGEWKEEEPEGPKEPKVIEYEGDSWEAEE